MTEMNRRIFGATLAGAALAAPTIARAQAVTMRWAHVYEANEPYHTVALWAAEEFGRRTNGKFRIQVFAASTAGRESEINEGLSLGTVDMIYTGQLFAGRAHGPLAIGGAPFMFRDYGHWRTFAASPLFRELGEGYTRRTQHDVVAITYYGARHVTSNKAINTPADMRGLKIRVPDAPLYRMFPLAVGANPTPIAFAEVYLALSQGVVEAQENPLPTIQAKKFHEVQTHINLTGHITDALLTIVGGPAKAKMNATERETLYGILREAAVRSDREITKMEQDLVGWFRSAAGGSKTVVEPNRTPFREAVVPRHLGPDATWDKAVYDRLQALPSASA